MKSKIGQHWFWFMLAAVMVAIVGMLNFVTPMMTVGSGSMEPTLPTGSRILLHEQPAYDIGDVITFRADDGEIVTHRLIEYGKDGEFITQGDANPTPDVWEDPVTKADVMGKVIYQIKLLSPGYWTSFQGMALFACLAVILLLTLSKPKPSKKHVSNPSESLFSH